MHSYAAPTPTRFYIHDDISDDIRGEFGDYSQAFRLTQDLFDAATSGPNTVIVLTVQEQIDLLTLKVEFSPFDVTIGIGRAGERVAQQVHERTGWFPEIRRVEVARQEDGEGGYTLVSLSGISIADQLADLDDADSIAVVDDTLFSGFTMTEVLRALPASALDRTHAFCLRCVQESLDAVRELCPITTGLEAEGRRLTDVSFINASGLVKRVGIRPPDGPPMAFFERRDWMEAWFPGYVDKVIDLCQRLNEILEPD